MSVPEQYFILIYDVASRALQIEPFERDSDAAIDRYEELEEQHRGSDEIEVVLVGADSIETIKRTHSHYFVERFDDLFREFLESAAPPGS